MFWLIIDQRFFISIKVNSVNIYSNGNLIDLVLGIFLLITEAEAISEVYQKSFLVCSSCLYLTDSSNYSTVLRNFNSSDWLSPKDLLCSFSVLY